MQATRHFVLDPEGEAREREGRGGKGERPSSLLHRLAL